MIKQYTVKQGDTLWKIAGENGISLNTLILANPQIANPDLIYPGQVILIPGWPTAPEQDRPRPPMPPMRPMPSTPPESDISTPDTDNPTGFEPSEFEQQVIDLVNAERSAAGVAPLEINTTLSEVARTKSQDMIANNYFSHQSPTYGSPFEMMRMYGITYTYAGENIGKGQTTAESVMNSWMASPGHRENILNPNYTEIGVGYSDEGGVPHWTQMFIRP